MKTIAKYDCLLGMTFLDLPVGSKVVNVGAQRGYMRLWVLQDANNESERRTFVVYSTGQDINADDDIYVGTVEIAEFVWHVFERT